jgi:hypothetical protein
MESRLMSIVATVSTALGVPEVSVRETRPGELLLETTTSALPESADRITEGLSGRLLSLFASDERDSDGRFLLHHLWFLPNLRSFLQIVAPVLPSEPSYPSIAA